MRRFNLKVKKIDESVLNKIEDLRKGNNTKLLIKKYYLRNYQNKVMKSGYI